MSESSAELYILYQMGVSDQWTWFSVVAVFLSERALRVHARDKGMVTELELLEPSSSNKVVLTEPREYVVVKAREGEVPDVELEEPS